MVPIDLDFLKSRAANCSHSYGNSKLTQRHQTWTTAPCIPRSEWLARKKSCSTRIPTHKTFTRKLCDAKECSLGFGHERRRTEETFVHHLDICLIQSQEECVSCINLSHFIRKPFYFCINVMCGRPKLDAIGITIPIKMARNIVAVE